MDIWIYNDGYFIYNSNPDGELNKSKVIHSLYNKM